MKLLTPEEADALDRRRGTFCVSIGMNIYENAEPTCPHFPRPDGVWHLVWIPAGRMNPEGLHESFRTQAALCPLCFAMWVSAGLEGPDMVVAGPGRDGGAEGSG